MFMAVMKQHGEGCDYTIGCGMKYVELKAWNEGEALQELKHLVIGDDKDYEGGYTGDSKLEEAFIVKVAAQVNLEAWYHEYAAHWSGEADREKEKQEKEELARLKEKYE